MVASILNPVRLAQFFEIIFSPIIVALVIFLGFIVVGYLIGRVSAQVLTSIGIGEMVEGTTFERTAQGLGSSTVAVMARLTSWFIYGFGALFALHIVGVLDANLLWQQITIFVPRLFVAVLVVIIGIVIGEKAALVIQERLRSVKLPEVTVVAKLTKYSIIFLAALIALGQIGVVTTALVVVLAAYAFGVVFLGGIACKDLLSSGAAGMYLLYHQPYAIGDHVRIGDREGIVQEVGLFVTWVEGEEVEYVIPNNHVFAHGIGRIR